MTKLAQFFQWIKQHKKITGFVLVILLILGFFLRPKPPKPVATVTVTANDVTQTVSATGTIYANKSVDLNFLAGGKLVYLGVKKGDRVKVGQIIATLDQRTTQTNLQNALIDYNKQRNTFDTTQEANGNRAPKDALNDAMKRVLENNQNDLNKAINSVELLSLAKEQSVLTTPIAGVVTRADVNSPGINIAATTVFSIADTSDLIFKADVDEADIGKISDNQSMKISLDAFPDKTITIPIDSIDYTSHTTTTGGTAYTVQGKFPPNDGLYRIGMNGDVEIIVSQVSNRPTIPLSSLIDEKHVYVQKDKTFARRAITVGIQSDTEAEIISGLKIGEKVALTPDDVEKAFPKLKSE